MLPGWVNSDVDPGAAGVKYLSAKGKDAGFDPQVWKIP